MEKLFTKKQLAEMLQISIRTVDRRIKSLNLPIVQVGRLVRIPESSFQLMMKLSNVNHLNDKDNE
jgi:excisionase family DNA binding protein